jgi:hypothetical protein
MTREGQLSLIPSPVLLIEYDPDRHVWEDGLRIGAYVAWSPSLPHLVGTGSTEQRALGELAVLLKTAVDNGPGGLNELAPDAQLLFAASALPRRLLAQHLADLAAPPVLASR